MAFKIGIIGTGNISNSHVRGYQGNASLAQIVAVADIVEERARAAAARWGVSKWFTDYRKILEMKDVDAVSVCTYNQAHRQPTVDALEAGKHVLLEKPMAATLDDAITITRTARKTGKILMIAIHSRYSPQTIAAKRIMDSGALGPVYYGETISARRRGIGTGSFVKKATAGGGTVVDIGVYSLDTALYLLGHPTPARVSGIINSAISKDRSAVTYGGWTWNPDDNEVEDFGAAWVRFENGMCMTFKTSWAIHAPGMGRTFFLGEKGGLALNPLEFYADQFGMMVNLVPQDLPAEPDRFVEETRAFLEAIRDGKPSPIPPEQVIQTNVIMDALYRSAESRKEVAVTPWKDRI